MSLNGSGSRPDAPLHPALSLLTAALGTGAMLVSGLLLGRHLPLRVNITTGSILLAAPALLAYALLFALMHADLYRLLFAFAVGAALGVVRLRAGALLPCILVHATLNTLTFLAAPLVDDPSEPLPDPRPLLGAALLTAGL